MILLEVRVSLNYLKEISIQESTLLELLCKIRHFCNIIFRGGGAAKLKYQT